MLILKRLPETLTLKVGSKEVDEALEDALNSRVGDIALVIHSANHSVV